MELGMLRVGMRYGTNLVAMVARQQGYLAAGVTGGRFVLTEVAKVPRIVRWAMPQRGNSSQENSELPMYSAGIVNALSSLGVEMRDYHVDLDAFNAHVAAAGYPRNYAAGPLDEGGMREQKLLEYFVSLDLLDARPSDVVVDVASEWSVFPDVLRNLSGASVYRQDLRYPAGIRGDRIGGNAAGMPVPDGFADKLVLHNAFEHFEGTADTDFVAGAWRVLKPGGSLCILPLFVSDRYAILTDPLVDRRGVEWDVGAQIVERPWFHNRFARFYDAAALQRRVLAPANGLRATIYTIVNVKAVHPGAYLHFALVMRKPPAHGQAQ